MRILDTKEKVLRNKIIRLVKVLWQHHGVEEATWEPKLKKKYERSTHIYSLLEVSFEDETFFKGGGL